MGPLVTPEAISELLTAAGFTPAEMDDSRYRPVSEGFTTVLLPLPCDVVAIGWHDPRRDQAHVHEPSPVLARIAGALEAAGYRTEFVADVPAGYIEVWTDGEFC
jgi:hypothetical protein